MESQSSFVNLLNSQCSVDLDSPEPAWLNSQAKAETPVKERKKWSPKEDKILIGAWLNTSKDPVVANEQKAGAFWKRICDFFNASPLLVGAVPRETVQCKQRWARINDQVSKFVGCHDRAMREQRSGQNDDDVMKAALDMFYNDHGLKFGLEHCWRELRHDGKWCSSSVAKDAIKDKRKTVIDVDGDGDEGESRPVGIKAAKAATKRKKSGREEEMTKLQSLMEFKQKLSNQKLLTSLINKKEPLTDMESSLKLKLMAELI